MSAVPKPSLSDTPVLSGRLRQVSMPSFLEYLASSQHTGTLECEGPGEVRAHMSVQLGNIVRAVCDGERGVLEGLEAIRKVLSWRYVHVALLDGLPQVEPNVQGSIIGALLEAARLEDEARRERALPPAARIRIRNNVSAYEALGAPELMLLKKARNGMTVQELRQALNGLPVESAMLELHAQGILEVEGLPAPNANNTAEFRALLSMVLPLRMERRGAIKTPLPNGVPRTVYDLVDGRRSAEQIRTELHLSPGAIREVLKTLRGTGWVDY